MIPTALLNRDDIDWNVYNNRSFGKDLGRYVVDRVGGVTRALGVRVGYLQLMTVVSIEQLGRWTYCVSILNSVKVGYYS